MDSNVSLWKTSAKSFSADFLLQYYLRKKLEIGCKQGFQYTPLKIIWSWPAGQ